MITGQTYRVQVNGTDRVEKLTVTMQTDKYYWVKFDGGGVHVISKLRFELIYTLLEIL